MKKLALSKIKTRGGKNKTSYYYKANFGKCSLTGNRVEKMITGDTKKEVQTKFNEQQAFYYSNGETLLNRREYHLNSDGDVKTFDDLIVLWLDSLSLKSATILGYKSRARNHISPHIGQCKLNSLTLNDLQIVIDKIIKELAPKCDLWERVIYDYKNLFKFAFKRRFMADDLMMKVDYDIKKVKRHLNSTKIKIEDEDDIQFYDDEQLKKILPAISDYSKKNSYQAPCFSIYIKLLIYSGFRPSEALAITWNDVDFEKSTIRINKTLSEDSKIIGTPKTINSNRSITMNNLFMDELKRFKHTQQLIYWQMTEKRSTPEYVFTNMKNILSQKGKAWYTYQNFRNAWKRLCLRTDTPYLDGLHCFRHTHATMQLLNSKQSFEVKFKVVSERLGHSSITETIETYFHLLPQQKSNFNDDFDLYMDSLESSKSTLKIV